MTNSTTGRITVGKAGQPNVTTMNWYPWSNPKDIMMHVMRELVGNDPTTQLRLVTEMIQSIPTAGSELTMGSLCPPQYAPQQPQCQPIAYDPFGRPMAHMPQPATMDWGPQNMYTQHHQMQMGQPANQPDPSPNGFPQAQPMMGGASISSPNGFPQPMWTQCPPHAQGPMANPGVSQKVYKPQPTPDMMPKMDEFSFCHSKAPQSHPEMKAEAPQGEETAPTTQPVETKPVKLRFVDIHDGDDYNTIMDKLSVMVEGYKRTQSSTMRSVAKRAIAELKRRGDMVIRVSASTDDVEAHHVRTHYDQATQTISLVKHANGADQTIQVNQEDTEGLINQMFGLLN